MGVAAMCIGIYLKVSRSDFVEIFESKEFETSSALLISAGIIVCVVSLVGFIGAWLNNQCMLGLVSACFQLQVGLLNNIQCMLRLVSNSHISDTSLVNISEYRYLLQIRLLNNILLELGLVSTCFSYK